MSVAGGATRRRWGTLALAGALVNAVARSRDGGRTWQVANLGRATPGSLTVVPQSPATIFATTTFGIFRSADGGRSWSGRGGPGDSFDGAVVVTSGARWRAYAGVGGGITVSRNRGLTWTTISQTAANMFVRRMVLTPDGTRLVASGSTRHHRPTGIAVRRIAPPRSCK